MSFEIETDASSYGIGAVLIQGKRPIAYYGHTLAIRDRAKPMYERELMEAVLAVQRWRLYLLGRKFVVKTYQRSLKFLLEQRVIQLQHQKWIAKFLDDSFEVVYKPRLENKAVDALSRMPPTFHLYNLTAPTPINLAVIKEEVEKDDHLKKITTELEKSEELEGKYSIQQGMLKYKGRVVVSKSPTLIPTILHTYHDSIFGGHSGFLKTYKRLIGELYWIGMKQDVKKYCKECINFQRNNR